MPQSVEYLMRARACKYLMMDPKLSESVCEALYTYYHDCEEARQKLLGTLDDLFKNFDPPVERK
jgi:hypothetical protein